GAIWLPLLFFIQLDIVAQKSSDSSFQWKFSPTARDFFSKKNNEQQKFILSGTHTDDLVNALEKIKGPFIIISVDEPSHSVIINTTAKFIKEKLLVLKEIIFVDVRAEPYPEINIIGYNRSFHGINAVDYSIPNANGKNIVAGVKEQT